MAKVNEMFLFCSNCSFKNEENLAELHNEEKEWESIEFEPEMRKLQKKSSICISASPFDVEYFLFYESVYIIYETESKRKQNANARFICPCVFGCIC